jgi:hypothetical protein
MTVCWDQQKKIHFFYRDREEKIKLPHQVFSALRVHIHLNIAIFSISLFFCAVIISRYKFCVECCRWVYSFFFSFIRCGGVLCVCTSQKFFIDNFHSESRDLTMDVERRTTTTTMDWVKSGWTKQKCARNSLFIVSDGTLWREEGVSNIGPVCIQMCSGHRMFGRQTDGQRTAA